MLNSLLQVKSKLISNDPFGASSKRLSYIAKWKGQNYKLRQCFSIQDAEQLISRLAPISNLVCTPKLLSHEEEWLIFEYYNISEVTRNTTRKFWLELGTAIARLESVTSTISDPTFSQESETSTNLTQFVLQASSELLQANLISKDVHRKVEKATSILPTTYCYGYLDLLAGNILWNGTDIILADEEGFARTIAGLSLIRPFDIWHQYKPGIGVSQDEKRWLLEGYKHNGGNYKNTMEHEKELRTIYYLLKTHDSISSTGISTESLKRLKT